MNDGEAFYAPAGADSSGSSDGRGPTPFVPGFRDLVRIGRGGFSTVYSATQDGIERRVALKVLDPGVSDNERFLRECRTLGALSEVDGIVSVLQATFTAQGQPCIVMQLMGGSSIADRLRSNGPMSQSAVVESGIRLSSALQLAHDHGVFHRDIKPENVLFDSRGNASIADFGIALINGVAARSQTIESMSPPHAPPERFSGVSADPIRGDVYSLASTLYAALAGSPPFGTTADGGLAGLVARVSSDPVPELSTPGVDPALVAVLARAMSKDPLNRHGSMAELGTDLVAFAKGHTVMGVAAPRAGNNAPTAQWWQSLPEPIPSEPPLGLRPNSASPSLGGVPTAAPPATQLEGTVLRPSLPSSNVAPLPSGPNQFSSDWFIDPPVGPEGEKAPEWEPASGRRTVKRWMLIALAGVIALIVGVGVGGIFVVLSFTDTDSGKVDVADESVGDSTGSQRKTRTVDTPKKTAASPSTSAVSTKGVPVETVDTVAPDPASLPTTLPAPARRPARLAAPSSTTPPLTAPLPISEATTAVDMYLEAASSKDMEYFVDRWSFPIKLYYSDAKRNVDEATVRDASAKYWERFDDLDFYRNGPTRVTSVDGGWTTSTDYVAELWFIDGRYDCQRNRLDIGFNTRWQVRTIVEKSGPKC